MTKIVPDGFRLTPREPAQKNVVTDVLVAGVERLNHNSGASHCPEINDLPKKGQNRTGYQEGLSGFIARCPVSAGYQVGYVSVPGFFQEDVPGFVDTHVLELE